MGDHVGEEETDFGSHFERRNVYPYSMERVGQLVKERERGRGSNVMNAKTCILVIWSLCMRAEKKAFQAVIPTPCAVQVFIN